MTGKIGIGHKCTKNDEKCDITNTGEKIGENCTFCPDPLEKSASLMGFQYMDPASVSFVMHSQYTISIVWNNKTR